MKSSAISTLDLQAASRGETPTCRNPSAAVGKVETSQFPVLVFRMVPPEPEPPAREPKRTFSSRWRRIQNNRDAQQTKERWEHAFSACPLLDRPPMLPVRNCTA